MKFTKFLGGAALSLALVLVSSTALASTTAYDGFTGGFHATELIGSESYTIDLNEYSSEVSMDFHYGGDNGEAGPTAIAVLIAYDERGNAIAGDSQSVGSWFTVSADVTGMRADYAEVDFYYFLPEDTVFDPQDTQEAYFSVSASVGEAELPDFQVSGVTADFDAETLSWTFENVGNADGGAGNDLFVTRVFLVHYNEDGSIADRNFIGRVLHSEDELGRDGARTYRISLNSATPYGANFAAYSGLEGDRYAFVVVTDARGALAESDPRWRSNNALSQDFSYDANGAAVLAE